MRIVFLSPSGQMGGAERSLLDILASLAEAKPEWDLHLVSSGEGPLVRRARAGGVKVTVVPFPPALALLGDAGVRGPAGDRVRRRTFLRRFAAAGPAIFRYYLRLKRVIRDLAPDIVHSNGFKMHILGAWVRPTSVPLVWHIHDYVSPRPLMSRLLRRNVGRCSLLITNSHSVAKDVRAICPGDCSVVPLYNAVDLATFAPTGEVIDLDALSGLGPAEPGTVRVGLVATLGRWKGHSLFLRSLAQAASTVPIRGFLIGDALYETSGSQYSLDNLRALAKELGISDRVGFTGFVDEPASAMRSLDVVVHASIQPEPFGLVVIEAMACGRALIASQAGGSAELFTHGENALGYPSGNIEALATRIEQLAADPQLRHRLGVAGRAHVEKHFDRSRLSQQLIPIYEKLVARPGDHA